jgi:hypothetical protein
MFVCFFGLNAQVHHIYICRVQLLGAEGTAEAGEPVEPPPSAAHTFGLMGAGAVGALVVAGIGVYGVLQMSLLVASSTGRSIHSKSDSAEESGGNYIDRK